MNIIIGSARHDERNKYSGGAKGDSLQTTTPDYNGEVSQQTFYVHTKGWMILVPKNTEVALKLAACMKQACNNKNIGYSQSDRYSILKYGTKSKVKCNCDCSSLVRQCVREATGIDPGDFTTANAVSILIATGQFQKAVPYTSKVQLFTGSILCTKTKGHIVIVTSGNTLQSYAATQARYNITKTSQKGVDLIKQFEGCKLKAYKAVATEKYYTIGYGHYGADVKSGMTITKAKAEEILKTDLRKFEEAVVCTGLNLNQNQFDALVSFTYNCGEGNLKKLINNRSLSQIADAILLYNKSGGKVLAGLQRRRAAERNLFLNK